MTAVTPKNFVPPQFPGDKPFVGVEIQTNYTKPSKLPPSLTKVWTFTDLRSNSQSLVHRLEIWKNQQGICKVSLFFRNTHFDKIKPKLDPLDLTPTQFMRTVLYDTTDPEKMCHLIETFHRNVTYNPAAALEIRSVFQQQFPKAKL